MVCADLVVYNKKKPVGMVLNHLTNTPKYTRLSMAHNLYIIKQLNSYSIYTPKIMADGGRELSEKMLKHRRSTLSKWPRDFSLAEVISEVTGKVWDRSDEESNKDEGNGIHAYLGAQYFSSFSWINVRTKKKFPG